MSNTFPQALNSSRRDFRRAVEDKSVKAVALSNMLHQGIRQSFAVREGQVLQLSTFQEGNNMSIFKQLGGG